MKKKSLAILILILTPFHCWADATFTPGSQLLHIPFVRYQNQFYQADLTYLSPDKLRLDSFSSQLEPLKKEAITPVYSDLSFHLSRITAGNKQYAADMNFMGDNIFQIHKLIESSDAKLSRTEFTSQHFSGSGICAQCHNDIQDSAGNDVSIIKAWQTTMMANATRDPFWQAKVRSELNRTPSQENIINDTCTRCHAPMANEEARKQHTPVQAIFEHGILDQRNAFYNLAMNGVSCSLCHQISPNAPFGTETGFSGNFVIDEFPTQQERLIYGPFKDLLTQPMLTFARFRPVYSEHIKSSELCASCHDLTTPYTDEQGNVLSQDASTEFPEQMPYSEWLHSDFSKTDSCQQCHMQRSHGVIISSQPPNLDTQRDDFAQHSFLGSNRLMLSILQDYRKTLGVTPKDFSQSLRHAQELLNDAAELDLSDVTLNQETLNFHLNIHSKTGHKLPSGYPSRRVIVHVTVRDAQNNIVFETGKVNNDGRVAKLDSDQNLNQYEPHYSLINAEEQVQVYEAVMQDYQDNVTYTLLRAKSYIKDNRLLPNGFNKQTAPNKIKVQGAAALDDDFIGGSDSIEFNLSNLPEKKYSIEAELIYQTLGYAFAQDLFTDSAQEVSRFKQMFNASELKSTQMKKIQLDVER